MLAGHLEYCILHVEYSIIMIFIETLLLDGFLATIRTYSRVFDGLGSFEKKTLLPATFFKK